MPVLRNDAGKKVKGYKRYILVDTLGLFLIVHVVMIIARTTMKKNEQRTLARFIPG